MASYALRKLQAEMSAAFTQLFTFNSDTIRQFETGEYVAVIARGSKRVQSILGIDREILILGNVYNDQQPRSVQFAKRLVADSEGRLETTVCIIVHQDPRGNAKLMTTSSSFPPRSTVGQSAQSFAAGQNAGDLPQPGA